MKNAYTSNAEKPKKLITYSIIILLGILAIIGWQQAESLRQELTGNRAILNDWEQVIQKQQKVIDDYGKSLHKQQEVADYYTSAYLKASYQIRELESNPIIKEVYKEVYIDRPVDRIVIKSPEWTIFDKIEDVPVATVVAFEPNVCLDIAKNLQQMYLDDGYITSVVFALNHYYYGTYVTDVSGGHAGLLIETKQGWYFIDVQPWRVTKLFEERK